MLELELPLPPPESIITKEQQQEQLPEARGDCMIDFGIVDDVLFEM